MGVLTVPLAGARLVLLAGATVLAFFSGGYFDEARAWAGLIAWALVVVAVLLEPRAFPRSRSAWLALGGLLLWAGWSLLSMVWAPLAGNAYHSAQLVFLYAGGLLAATMLLRAPAARTVVEPALAVGATIVIGYGISERLLPGLLHFSQTPAAFGRLEQPLTYWNAMGELAALGLVLWARLIGDASRPLALRLLAAAASAPMGMGLYLSFSRGAIFAWAAGLVALLVATARREQLRGLLVGIGAAVLAAAASAPFKGLTALTGTLATRERQGAAVLVLLAGIMLAAVIVAWQLIRTERPGALRLPRHAPRLALALICAGLAVAIVAGAKEGHNRPLSGGAGRLVSFTSTRYAYWGVALRAFGQEPLHGVGAGNWSVWWLKYRTVNEFATDAHSLPLQTMAELGLVGLALLLSVVGGLALSARAAHRRDWARAAGPIAGLVAYAAHAPLDWDWQMPAVTLIAIALAGAVLAQAEQARREARPARRETAISA
jgi:uncharacterized integral membrane protein